MEYSTNWRMCLLYIDGITLFAYNEREGTKANRFPGQYLKRNLPSVIGGDELKYGAKRQKPALASRLICKIYGKS
jgi:hypothetical protein